MQVIDHFYTMRCQSIGFISILGDQVVGFQVFQVKIHFSVITDSEMSGDIHETHFPLPG